MNSFDAAVYLGLAIAVVTGFNAGLLRSAVTILAYLFAISESRGARSGVVTTNHRIQASSRVSRIVTKP